MHAYYAMNYAFPEFTVLLAEVPTGNYGADCSALPIFRFRHRRYNLGMTNKPTKTVTATTSLQKSGPSNGHGFLKILCMIWCYHIFTQKSNGKKETKKLKYQKFEI